MAASKESVPGRQADLVRVLVVDDHRTIAELLGAMIRSQPDLECVANVYSADDAEQFVTNSAIAPDVAIIDVDMPGRDGLALAGRLIELSPPMRVVIMTSHATPEIFARATAAGAAAETAAAAAAGNVSSGARAVGGETG